MATFKNYAVNYTLSVNLSETAGLNALLEQINVAENALKNFRSSISGIQKPFNDFARNIGRMHKSLNEMRNMGALQITPTLDISSFDAQCKQLIVKAEQAAAVISGTFNSAFNVKPKGKGGGKVISIDDQIKALEKDIKSANAQLTALNPAIMSKKDYEAQKKNFGTFISQKEDELKKLKGKSGQLAQDRLAQIPAIIVSNEETIASLNAVIGQLNKQIRPIVIPITVATNIDAAKGVKETVNGLKGVAKQVTGTAPVKAPKTSGTSAINKAKTYVSPTTKISSSAAGVLPFQKGIASLANTVQQEVRPIIRIDANILPALQKLAELVNAINRNKNHVINISAVGNVGGGAVSGASGVSGGASGTTNITGITNTGNTGKAGKSSGKSNGLSAYTNSLLEEFKPISDRIEATKRAEEQVKKAKAAEAKSYKEWWQKTGGPTADANQALMMMGFSNPDVHPQATNATKQLQKAFEATQRSDYVKWWETALAQRDAAMDAERALSAMRLSNPNAHGPASQKTRAAQRKWEAQERANKETSYVKWWEEELKKQEERGRRFKSTQEQARKGQPYIQRGGGRRASMNSFGYQLMGNTSLGARTPVFLDMMKGMGMMTGVGAIMGTLTDAFTNSAEYQNTMVTAKAILGANYKGNNFEGDFDRMAQITREVAKQTKFTAPQAADAVRFMAMAGLNIPMINASIKPIADVAVIGDNDLGEVADKITNIQTAFKIKPEQMRSLADALTKTFTSSNTDMMMLAESMEYAAPMAHLAGAKVEDALAMIGIMGNAGIQGSMAGTTLRMMYQNIINPNKNQKLMWEKLGINLKDDKGNPRQLIEILGDLRKRVRITSEDKELGGEFKDEGTPIAEAVSRLFRVTASAGAGTLIENLDKVIALAEANRNAGGLAESISITKQNDIKGMWFKLTSAFTDAVVSEFEGNNSPLKGYLSDMTQYFNSTEFKDLLHELFDLVKSMMGMLSTFLKIWKFIWGKFKGIIKYTMAAQFFFAQIGYLIAPAFSVFKLFQRGLSAFGGLSMAGRTMNLGNTIANIGSASVSANALKNLTPISGKVGSWEFVGSASLNSAIKRNQISGENMAAAATLLASMRQQVSDRAAKRIAGRTTSTAVLNRAVQMGKIGGWKATGMAMSSGFRSAATWGMAGMSMAGMFGGLRSVLALVAKLFGGLLNPLSLATAGILALGHAAMKTDDLLKKQREKFKKQDETIQSVRDVARGNITNTVLEDRVGLGYGIMRLGKINENFDFGSIGGGAEVNGIKLAKNPLMRNLNGVNELFGNTFANGYVGSALEHISGMSRIMYGQNLNSDEVWDKLGYKMSGYQTSGRVASHQLANEAAIAAVMESVRKYVFADKLMAPIKQRLEKWAEIKDQEESEREWAKIQADARIMAEQYNPEGRGLKKLRGNYSNEQIGAMRFSEVVNTYEGQKSLYDMLKSVNDPDHPIFGYFYGLKQLRSNVSMSAQGVMDAVMRMTGGVQYELPDMNGQLKTVTQAFNGGRLKWEDFQANIQAYGLNVKDTLGAFHQIIYKTFLETRQIAIDAGKIPPSIQDFIKQNGGMGFSEWDINHMSNDQLKQHLTSMRRRWENDPVFRASIGETEEDWNKFEKKNFGLSGMWPFRTQNRPSPSVVNDTQNYWLEQQAIKDGTAGEQQVPPQAKTNQNWKQKWGINNWSTNKNSSYNINQAIPPSQQSYASIYGSTPTTINPINIHIDKLEANAMTKEEIDVNKFADIISDKFTSHLIGLYS